jgi:hypothetical protein
MDRLPSHLYGGYGPRHNGFVTGASLQLTLRWRSLRLRSPAVTLRNYVPAPAALRHDATRARLALALPSIVGRR